MQKFTNRHLVLDIDSTLANTFPTMDGHGSANERVYYLELTDGDSITPMWGVFRPHLVEFMNFADQYFEQIHIWSAGQYQYVHQIVDIMADTTLISPSTVFTYDNCAYNMTSDQYIYKPLSKIYQAVTTANPMNTLVIDDRKETFSRNPSNGILIPPYEPKIDEIDIEDNALLKIICWLSLPQVIATSDVRLLDKRNIFTVSLDKYRCVLKESFNIF